MAPLCVLENALFGMGNMLTLQLWQVTHTPEKVTLPDSAGNTTSSALRTNLLSLPANMMCRLQRRTRNLGITNQEDLLLVLIDIDDRG